MTTDERDRDRDQAQEAPAPPAPDDLAALEEAVFERQPRSAVRYPDPRKFRVSPNLYSAPVRSREDDPQ